MDGISILTNIIEIRTFSQIGYLDRIPIELFFLHHSLSKIKGHLGTLLKYIQSTDIDLWLF